MMWQKFSGTGTANCSSNKLQLNALPQSLDKNKWIRI